MDAKDEMSNRTVRTSTPGVEEVISFATASTLVEVRPVKTNNLGPRVASDCARAAPRPLGLTPVMRTNKSKMSEQKRGICGGWLYVVSPIFPSTASGKATRTSLASVFAPNSLWEAILINTSRCKEHGADGAGWLIFR